MARIRTVKPEFWADEKIARLPRDARLLLIGMFNFADDDGRLRGSPLLIRSQVFPYDSDVDSESLLRALAEASLIVRYESGSEQLIWIRNFNKHQKIDHPSKSTLPAPPASSSNRSPKAREESSKPQEQLSEDSTTEGKGREGKGEEVKALSAPPTDAVQLFEFWKEVHGHKQAKFTLERQRKVKARLKDGYTVDRIRAAIRGCAVSPHHQGKNDSGTVYDDLELICRSGAFVEKFEALAPYAVTPLPRRKTDAEIEDEVKKEFEAENG